MPDRNARIGALVREGILLFSKAVPIPASTLVAAIASAVVFKILELRERRVSEILSQELRLAHISYIQPDDAALLTFYFSNPLHPELALEFEEELESNDLDRLRELYPFLYNALVLRRQLPTILFHQEIEKKEFRKMATDYELLARGFRTVDGSPELQDKVNHFALELLEVLNEVYEAVKDEIQDSKNEFAFEIIDFVREAATT